MSQPATRPAPPPAPSGTAPTDSGADSRADSRADLRAGSVVLAEFDDYAGAQALVDRLSDEGFPVRHVRIVGTGIHSVEQVTGRLTVARAALAGAASGAWFGLFVGLLFGLFTLGVGRLSVLLVSVLLGAAFGAAFGALAHWATRGRRDFASVKGLAAHSYAVHVDADRAAEARAVLGRR